MGSTKENRFTGTVVGHTVKFFPKITQHKGAGITITKESKLGALVTIQVDDRKIHTVPSKRAEVILGEKDLTPEARAAVYDMLRLEHPFNSERSFSEYITTRSKGSATRKYELEE